MALVFFSASTLAESVGFAVPLGVGGKQLRRSSGEEEIFGEDLSKWLQIIKIKNASDEQKTHRDAH